MKKYLSLALFAVFGLFWSCSDDNIVAVYDPANVTVPGLGDIVGIELTEDGDAISTTYDEASFGLDVPRGYTLYAAQSGTNFDPMVKVSSAIKDGKITIKQPALNSLILNMGGVAGEPFSLDFKLIATALTDKSVAVASTAVESNVVTASFTPYDAEILDKDKFPTAYIPGGYQAKGDGGKGWVFTDEQYLYDYEGAGVYTGLVDFYEVGAAGLDYGFKLTLAPTWDEGDYGAPAGVTLESEPSVVDLKSKPADAENDNILCFDAHRFYMFSFEPSAKTLTKVYAFDNVGIVGAFNGWNAADENCKMTYNKYYHRFYIDWTFDDATELKFTCDDAWDRNWGVDCVSGGDNIPVQAGSYRVYLDLNKKTYEFNEKMFGKEEPGGTPVEPEPEPAYQGWGMIGSFNEWGGDAPMTETDGVWTGYVNLDADAEWKLRKDADWTENFGGTFVAFGEPFEAVSGGDNIKLGQAGFFKVVFDSNAGTITVTEGDVWSLIGTLNGSNWDTDYFCTEVDGKWVSPIFSIEDGQAFKFRYNMSWDNNYGGVFANLDEAFEAVAGGDDIKLPAGKYIATLDPEAKTIVVVNAAKSWGVIGNFNGWAEDVDMTEVVPGVWVSPVLELTEGWKVRFDDGWDVNRGGVTPSEAGVAVAAVPGGSDINLAGTYSVVYNANSEVIYVLRWGVVGSIASIKDFNWNADVPMNLGADGKWYSSPIALTTEDRFKIREFAGWDNNRGGVCAAIGEAFEVTNGGSDMFVPADGTYMVVYDPANETIELTTNFWGLIGNFNGWSGDVFMANLGNGVWAAYNQTLEGGWKIRQAAGWDNNRGGVFAESGVPFEVTNGGADIDTNRATVDIVYDSAAETITATAH